MRLYGVLVLFCIISLQPEIAHAQLSCGTSEVSINGFQIQVEPVSGDDTDNIECALREATRLGIGIVQLSAGTFEIANLVASDFEGSLRGVSKDLTILNATDRQMRCNSTVVGEAGSSVVMKFIRGAPRLEKMTVRAGFPCNEGPVQDFVVLAFTTTTEGGACSDRVRFASLDRVRLLGDNSNSAFRVAVSNSNSGSCGRVNEFSALGTLSVNQSEFVGWRNGISTSAVGASKVDISNNYFEGVAASISAFDSNQVMSIFNNEFRLTDTIGGPCAVAVTMQRTRENGPNQDRVVIYQNVFSEEIKDTCPIVITNRAKRASLSVNIANNRFVSAMPELRPNFIGVSISDIDAGTITGNRFTGKGTSISIGTRDHSEDVTGWAFSGNVMTESASDGFVDISFRAGTADNYAGPNQGSVLDNTGLNDTALFTGDMSKSSGSSLLEAELPPDPEKAAK